MSTITAKDGVGFSCKSGKSSLVETSQGSFRSRDASTTVKGTVWGRAVCTHA
ncbi:hypothetical protein ABZ468_37310 [Streptomyces sp. NPDC005708]|uniref:hypothetical protein n=1 Tax=Streptomyces sp. NPDC005708 TaxID=3154564 RepID=UPI0033F101B7